jgi:hypothetical protein
MYGKRTNHNSRGVSPASWGATGGMPFLAGAALVLLGALLCGAAAAERMRIDVADEPRQVFGGFGASCTHQESHAENREAYAALPEETRRQLAQLMWGKDGADFRILRLWTGTRYSGAEMVDWFGAYVDDVLAAQPDAVILLAPTGTPRDPPSFASHYAQMIEDMAQGGMKVHATGICNEPNVRNVPPETIPEVVKAFRGELDARDLSDVEVVAPEAGSVDGTGLAMIDAIRNDAEALRSIGGFATHSYNMAANDSVVDRIDGLGKEYWQTESCVDEQWSADDSRVAPVVASTILGDLNHLVDHWLFFISTQQSVYGTTLVGLEPEGNPTITLQFYYMLQLSKTFSVGCRFRYCESDTPLPNVSMAWEYGQKPAISAAAAVNPDGTWGIAVSNCTGMGDITTYDGNVIAWTYPEATYEVTVNVAELCSEGEIGFSMCRRNAALRDKAECEQVLMTDGAVRVTVEPKELICLRSTTRMATRPTPMAQGKAGREVVCRLLNLAGHGGAGVPGGTGTGLKEYELFDARGARVREASVVTGVYVARRASGVR